MVDKVPPNNANQPNAPSPPPPGTIKGYQAKPFYWNKTYFDSEDASHFWATLSKTIGDQITKEGKKMTKAMKKMQDENNDDD